MMMINSHAMFLLYTFLSVLSCYNHKLCTNLCKWYDTNLPKG